MVEISPLGIKGEVSLQSMAKLLEAGVADVLRVTPHGELPARVQHHGRQVL